MIIDALKATSGGTLSIDETGVGKPVIDMFWEKGLTPFGITITGVGQATNKAKKVLKENGMFITPSVRDQYTWSIPKRDLVADISICLQNHILKIASSLPEHKTLINELMNFKVTISQKGHDSYEAWREGIHDDMVLATALALWTAIHIGGGNGFFFGLDLGQTNDYTALCIIQRKEQEKKPLRLPDPIPSTVPEIFYEKTRVRSPLDAIRENTTGGSDIIDLPSLW